MQKSAWPSSGWFRAKGDPPGTMRFWDGERWSGNEVPVDSFVHDSYRLPLVQNRFAARFIDLGFWVLFYTIFKLIESNFLLGFSDGLRRIFVVGFTLLAIVVFEVFYLTRDNATPGKQFMNLKVVHKPTKGDKQLYEVDRSAAFKRMFILVIGVITAGSVEILFGRGVANIFLTLFFVFGLSYGAYSIYFDTNFQLTPWDKQANTIVITDG